MRTAITVAALTRIIRGIPVEVRLGPEDGLPEECVANLDSILTIPKASLKERIAVLSSEKMSAVARAIKFALDLD